MKIAYLIFGYKNPKLMRRTIAHLSSENCAFFIHIDSKSNMHDFAAIRGENIFFTERIPVYWAEFSGVRAILILIRNALSDIQHFERLVLLSGSEYPLRSGEYIHSFFESNRKTEFINIVKMPNLEAGKPISRITTIRHPLRHPVRRFVFRTLAEAGLAQRNHRKHLRDLEPFGGNTWWALTREACEYILDFEQRYPHLTKYFEQVFSPEEYFIHTILGNSRFMAGQQRSLIYEDWSAKTGHPAMIKENHISFFEAQKKVWVNDVFGSGELLFARKFSDENLGLLERIDKMIECKGN